jgi:enoyl-CoA hydratase/carnithine racemase
MKHELASGDRVRCAMDAHGVAQVALARADKLNALDLAMFDALVGLGERLATLPGLRCVVLSGDGAGFSAGLDIAAFGAVLAGGDALGAPTPGAVTRFQQAAVQWRKLPVPVIAAVHGVCFGGALQIAGGADIRVVSPEARLAVMEMRWGLVPDMGGFALWRGRVRDDVLRELTYTNRAFSGEEALTLGFATLLDGDPLARATALAREIASRSPDAVRAAKALFEVSADVSFDAILGAESAAQRRLIGAPNQIEAIASQTEGRPARFVDR